MKNANLNLKVASSIAYWVLFLGGYYALNNFSRYANEAEDIKRTIEENNKTLLEKIRVKQEMKIGVIPQKLYSIIRFPFLKTKNYIHRLLMMTIVYFIVGILPWLFSLAE
jgi:hypothetical protein